ncbi:hypothetical protein SDC9_155662 [bioreactor metagenome]|uniref:Uncharacterized protein n=1 Tax=bioreactor metagenome TaxID=1076179 RepID=A0A645F3G2_9ZZZZ
MCGIEKPQQQTCQRGFSGTRRADHGRDGAGLHVEADPGQHPMLCRIRITHLLETHGIAFRMRWLPRRRLRQHRSVQQCQHALGRTGCTLQVMQQGMQQQKRRTNTGRDKCERQYIKRLHPAHGDKRSARSQHHTENGHRRNQCMRTGHGDHQWASEIRKCTGKSIHGISVTGVDRTRTTKSLDDRNPARELHRSAVDPPKPCNELLHVSIAGFHCALEKNEESGKWQQRKDRHAPIQHKQINHCNHNRPGRTPHGGIEMRGQAVQRRDIVLQCLLDLPRGAGCEPAQRHLR